MLQLKHMDFLGSLVLPVFFSIFNRIASINTAYKKTAEAVFL